MATHFAGGTGQTERFWLNLPERIPDLKRPWLTLFELLWFPALLLAVIGPLAGTWYRFTSPGQNSALMVGSRVGMVLSRDDLTHVRFPVGTAARTAGIRSGDKIIAIDGIPVSRVVPLKPTAESHGTDTDYALFSPIIEGTDSTDFDFTLRSSAGQLKQFHVTTGERHIEQSSERLGISPAFLSVVDLVHILTYPFLLFAAWILHRRKREDLVSSILSLAILLTIATEQPSFDFLTFRAGLPQWLHQSLYDIGNICLLAGILLFPFGRLRPRASLAFLLLLPILFFLDGAAYRLALIAFMAAGVLTLVWRLRSTPEGAARQQIKWALFGFSGYALFFALALASDDAKLRVGTFASQLSLEIFAGLSFGLAFASLQLGLMIALLRYRLYDAEVVISRSANFALITLGVATVFAAVGDALKQIVYNYSGNTNNEGPIMFAAALATVMINPIQERVQRWSEKRFQRNLLTLRDELPECVRDLRETASLDELLSEILRRVEEGVRTVRVALLLDGSPALSRGIPLHEAAAWLATDHALSCHEKLCETADTTFPVRVPLAPGDEAPPLGCLLVGPRPDGSIISSDEQNALIEVAEPIARAIRAVTKREAREGEIAAAIEANRRQIKALEARLAGTAKSRRRRTVNSPSVD